MLESADYIDQYVDLLTPAQIEESLHAVAVGSESGSRLRGTYLSFLFAVCMLYDVCIL